MIASIGLHQCDSFDEQDIDQLEFDLENLEGPSLKDFKILREETPILTFATGDIIKSLVEQDGRDIKYIGKDPYASYRSFFYVLLLIGVEEKRYYPHLNTLIREQFYKPNIFKITDEGRANLGDSHQMLQKSLKYFQEIGEGIRLEQYITKQPIFTDAGVIMLRNSIEEDDERGIFQQLAAKFNIDLNVVRREGESECLQLGANRRFHIFKEADYYFVGTTQQKDDLGLSRLELQSVRSGESGLLVLPQQSDQSTPKFKNSEVKFRKKSHKNSFGGDNEIVQYRDLLHLQSQRLMNNKPQVQSQFYEMNEVLSCADVKNEAEPKKHTFQDIIDGGNSEKNIVKTQMKGSITMEHYQNPIERRKIRKISASQIIQYKDFSNRLHRIQSLPQQSTNSEDEDAKSNSYSSLVVVKEENLPSAKMRNSLITQGPLQRIQERLSSQRQSTHPDLQSELSDVQVEVSVDNESQVKLKDRKYSYFTQQVASNKNKKQKQIQGSNYVFKIPKNLHKNSEYIEPGGHQFGLNYRRFQQNPLRFSQLGYPSEQSALDSMFQNQQLSRQKQLKLNTSVYSYMVKFQPQNWYKKEIIYHLPNNQKEILVFQRSYPLPEIQSTSMLMTKRNCYTQSIAEPTMSLKSVGIHQSFGSCTSMLSNIEMKEPHTHSIKNQSSQMTKGYNPFELNQSSFLKNRIQSMVNLQTTPNNQQTDDSKSMTFTSSRSMKEIKPDRQVSKSKVKINFKYGATNSTVPSVPSSPMVRRVSQTQPLQFRSVNQTFKSPTNLMNFGGNASRGEPAFRNQIQDIYFRSPTK